MTIDVYWGSGSPYSWRVLLALEHKGLEYRDIANADPARKPPQTCRVRSVSLVVRDELGSRIDAELGEA